MKKINRLILTIFLFILCAFSSGQKGYPQKIDLSGTWQFAVDPSDRGVLEKWFNQPLKDHITLPGSMTSNGKGDDISVATPWTGGIVDSSFFTKPEYARFREPGNIKVPFWLQPLKYYKGAAWYQKDVIIPAAWAGQYVELFLERCHWESRLWVDGKEIGMQNSLGTPHRYVLTSFLTPGKHRLSLCIDNRVKNIDPGENSHSISDHTQTNWNGMVGQLYLEARRPVNIRNIAVYPDIKNKKIAVKVKILNTTSKTASVKLDLLVSGLEKSESKSFEAKVGENVFELNLSLGDDVKLWNEFHPNIYTLQARLKDNTSGKTDICVTTFGMREIKTVGNQLQINGKPLFLRGTLECAIFPKTGFPPTDTASWMRIFRIARAHGLNHLRFHSWCPPQAAFDAADLSGFYLHIECSSWANQSTTLGDGKPFDKYLYEESQHIVETYGNHPSFCMMLYGNEPGGKNVNNFLTEFVKFWKNKDNRRIYCSGSGWPNLQVNDFLSDSKPRIQGWGQGLKSIINAETPRTDYDWSDYVSKFTQPMVSHEIGQWCVYPNFKEIAKYTGVLRAKNFEIFQESLKDNGMAALADSFLLASGKLQALCYKADIEAALRTKDFGGFQLLDLHDFPGQGTALVGVLDAFWDEKGYISPAEYKCFCNSTVALARLKKCIFANDETFEAAVEVAHYGDDPIAACTPEWKIIDKTGREIQSGKLSKTDIPLGNGFKLGNVSYPLHSVSVPEELVFEVNVNGTKNSWNFWVYPAKKEIIAGEENIKVVQKLDAQTAQFLINGGSVLLNLKKGTLAKELGGDVQIGFSSIFWNTAWTGKQAPHTLGLLCDPKHAALADFPTEYHSNWQWWDAMSYSGAINLSSFPAGVNPIVRVIDDWVTNRPLALLFEVKVGKGKLLVSGIDFNQNLDKRPEAQQLLYSLKKYMSGSQFNPTVEVALEQINKL